MFRKVKPAQHLNLWQKKRKKPASASFGKTHCVFESTWHRTETACTAQWDWEMKQTLQWEELRATGVSSSFSILEIHSLKTSGLEAGVNPVKVLRMINLPQALDYICNFLKVKCKSHRSQGVFQHNSDTLGLWAIAFFFTFFSTFSPVFPSQSRKWEIERERGRYCNTPR